MSNLFKILESNPGTNDNSRRQQEDQSDIQMYQNPNFKNSPMNAIQNSNIPNSIEVPNLSGSNFSNSYPNINSGYPPEPHYAPTYQPQNIPSYGQYSNPSYNMNEERTSDDSVPNLPPLQSSVYFQNVPVNSIANLGGGSNLSSGSSLPTGSSLASGSSASTQPGIPNQHTTTGGSQIPNNYMTYSSASPLNNPSSSGTNYYPSHELPPILPNPTNEVTDYFLGGNPYNSYQTQGYNYQTQLIPQPTMATGGIPQSPIQGVRKPRRQTTTVHNMTPDTAAKNKCSICQKQFKRPSSLQTHMYSHTGEKLFRCPWKECGKQFSVKSNMTRHYRLHFREMK